MYEFLTDDLAVPQSHIVSLRDNNATRAAIIGAIDNFSTDVRIKKGDPILIYFAGHGGLTKAEPEWKEKNGSEYIQVVFPWDYDPSAPEQGESGHPIPDRTIRGLINKLSKAKGDNIVCWFH
jgi:hypothetical protein